MEGDKAELHIFFTIVLTCQLSASIAGVTFQPLYLGQACPDTTCTALPNGRCTSGVCECDDGFFENSMHQCSPKLAPGQVCNETSQCVNNATCTSNRCTCGDGLVAIAGSCVTRLAPGQLCNVTSQCMENAICINNSCICGDGYFALADSCHRVPAVGEACMDLKCLGLPNSDCSFGECVCKHGYFGFAGDQRCYPRIPPNQICNSSRPHPEQCIDNATCTTGICTCDDGFIAAEGTCQPDCQAGQYTHVSVGELCRACPEGTYQELPRQLNCTDCPNGTSTKAEGAALASECQPVCSPGEQYNNNVSSCVPCPQGTWNSGNWTQRFEQCVVCLDGYLTEGEGSTHPDNCTLAVCGPGEQYNNNVSSCVPCPQGTWNSGNWTQRFEQCVACLDGYVTEGEGSTHPDNCTLDCPAGQHIDTNGTEEVCRSCPHGTFQNSPRQHSCSACPSGTSTHSEGSLQSSDCQYICSLGKQYNRNSCVLCPQGTWNSGNMTQRFESCISCPDGYVTEGEGSTHPDNCTLDCPSGQHIHTNDTEEVCRPCPLGSFQHIPRQHSCDACPSGTSTRSEGSSQPSDCQHFCGPGEQYHGNSCVPCPCNTWNSGNGTQRFESCVSCPVGYVTKEEGATHSDNCTLRDCSAGHFIDTTRGGDCVPCPEETYQDKVRQFNCIQCPEGTTTDSQAAEQLSDCKALPGLEITTSMDLKYALVQVCTVSDETSVRTTLRTKLLDLHSDWPGLCPDETCQNAQISASCGQNAEKTVLAVVSLDNLPITLTSSSDSTTMTARDMLLTSAVGGDAFSLEELGAQLVKNAVLVSVSRTCKQGYRSSGGGCVRIEENSDSSALSTEVIASIGGSIGFVVLVVAGIIIGVKVRRRKGPGTYSKTDRTSRDQPEHAYNHPSAGYIGSHGHRTDSVELQPVYPSYFHGVGSAGYTNPSPEYDYIGDIHKTNDYLQPGSTVSSQRVAPHHENGFLSASPAATSTPRYANSGHFGETSPKATPFSPTASSTLSSGGRGRATWAREGSGRAYDRAKESSNGRRGGAYWDSSGRQDGAKWESRGRHDRANLGGSQSGDRRRPTNPGDRRKKAKQGLEHGYDDVHTRQSRNTAYITSSGNDVHLTSSRNAHGPPRDFENFDLQSRYERPTQNGKEWKQNAVENRAFERASDTYVPPADYE